MYSELDKVETSMPTPKRLATALVEELKMAESNVEQILVNASMALIQILEHMRH